MKWVWQWGCLRLVIEWLSSLPAIRRYRVLPPALEDQARRRLHRRITGRLIRT